MSDVYVYIYDLSMGLARSLSNSLIGTQIEGIWHTGVVVYDKEIFYGSQGISQCRPCGTPLKEPLRKQFVGRTSITNEQLTQYLRNLSLTKFKGGHYRLFDHNCNTFSEHLVHYLTSQHIPDYVLDLPHIVASTPLGGLLKPALNSLSDGLNADPLFGGGAKERSFEDIRRSFKPILYMEPLSAEVSPCSIEQFWPANGESSPPSSGVQLAGKAKRLAEAVSTGLLDLPSDAEQFRLLDMDKLNSCDQAFIVLELFRLAFWRDPSFIMTMLTDPERSLHRLPQAALPGTSNEAGGISTLDAEMARCKLLCNYLGLTNDWDIDDGASLEGTGLLLQLDPLVHIALMLLGHSDHLWRPGDRLAVDPDHLVPQHRHVGLVMAHNLALHSGLNEHSATELGTYLIHLAVGKNKCYTQPTEAIHLLRTIYFLVIRFQFLADYARTCDLQDCLTVVLSEVSSPSATSSAARDGVSSLGKVGSSQANGTTCSSNGLGLSSPEGNPDFEFVSYLIDFLNSD